MFSIPERRKQILISLPHNTSLLLLILFFLGGCGGKNVSSPGDYRLDRHELKRIGYTVQVGAFSEVNNAIKLTNDLQKQGINAYYFLYKGGIYKVRFGNFPSERIAYMKARKLKAAGLIDEFYIVNPGQYAVAKHRERGGQFLRRKIVSTAKSFIGIPYRWGGSSSKEGFDCSGFTVAVYDLNGMELPRSSREQYHTGRLVKRHALSKGDLVFFATSGGRKVSHVGIFLGDDNFIHAPRAGQRIRIDSLENGYFKKRFIGARRYF